MFSVLFPIAAAAAIMAQVAARSFFHAGQGSNLTGRCADALRGARQNDALPGSQSVRGR